MSLSANDRRWIAWILGALLLAAIARLPIGYYSFLRLAVFAGGAVLVWQAWQAQRQLGVAAMLVALIALLFNPIVPVHFYDKGTWQVIDLACGIFFLWYGSSMKE